MPIRMTGLHVDAFGHGCADYFERPLSDLGMTDLVHRERKLSMIALYAAHMAQLRPFRIYKVQSDGNLHFVEAVQTFDDATALVGRPGELSPGEYVIENEETGARVFINTWD